MKTKILLTAILMTCTTGVFSQIINVPGDQPTIQAGIDVATNGDTVLVAQETWFENINFNGKAITVASHYLIEPDDSSHIYNTIINGSNPANPNFSSVVTFLTGEDTTSVLSGFTITGGTGMYLSSDDARIGGGIVCYYASAKITHNIIEGNEVNYSNHAWGAGIAGIKESGDYWTVVTNNIVRDNQAISVTGTATGGGMEIWGNARISNNRIEDNHCTSESGFSGGGGAVIVSVNNPQDTLYFNNNIVSNNTTLSNSETAFGGGVFVESSVSFISNNTIQNNQCEGLTYSKGGGILINNASATLHSNIVSFNITSSNDGSFGGGVSMEYSDTYLFGNEISHNHVTSYEADGGGVHYFHPVMINFENNTIVNNKVFTEYRWAGAGVVCWFPEGKSTYKNNYFFGNAGPIYSTYPQLVDFGSGGGFMIYEAGDNEIVVDGNIFRADTAKYGGGFSIKHSFNVKVTNNLCIENNGYYGGAMDLVNINWDGKEDLHPQFTNNTFFNNTTEDNGYAGAMYLWCEINLPPVTFNNIFYENQSPNGNDIYLKNIADTVMIAYSNIDPANIAGNSPWKELENINENPGFIDDSCHIDQDSPCKDMGVDSLEIAGIWYYAPETDYEGDPRPFGEGIDMGADEYDTIATKLPNPFVANVQKIILQQNRPNPFIDHTFIEFTLPREEKVTLKVFDLAGREIETMIAGYLSKGDHTFVLNSKNLNSGIYFYLLSAGDVNITKKMVVRK
ncbi:MAG: T9SS type A sorting domain-containing protein, partial [Bacteroidales bacterium]|nr:T9SS type A sorting domain-containing protein [Bacteroidales bacterium]